jgi:hypothetical protein
VALFTLLPSLAALGVEYVFAHSVYVDATEPTSFAALNVCELDSLVLSRSHVSRKERNTNRIMSDKVFPRPE